jgi:hypothetical protein
VLRERPYLFIGDPGYLYGCGIHGAPSFVGTP